MMLRKCLVGFFVVFLTKKGLVPKQHEEVETLKVQFRRANEIYLRSHPEVNAMISVFLCKLLEEQPDNILGYAGKFFDK